MKHIFFTHKHKAQESKAFTLIETMVAIVIIVMAVMGPLSVAVASSGYVRDTKDHTIATYLAQEGIDLLRYRKANIVINCVVNNDTPSCPGDILPVPLTATTTPRESSWRVFKAQMGTTTYNGFSNNSYCFSQTGCAYDINDILYTTPGNQAKPNLHDIGSGDCAYLYRNDTGDGTGDQDFLYRCFKAGETDGWTKTGFSRKITLQDIATSTGNATTDSYVRTYEDDIRVISEVTYIRHNGLTKTIKIVDYIHSNL